MFLNPAANAGADAALCNGSNTQLNASGGSSYSWSPTTGLSASNISNPVCSTTTAATYTVTVSDANGCSATDAVTIIVNELPTADAGFDWAVCSGTAAPLSASGGVSYSWSPSTGLSATNISNPTATPASSTTYIVTVTDANGCTATDNVVVTIHPLPTVTVNPSNYNLCKGQGVQLSAGGAVSYSWSPTIGLSASTGASVFANPGASATYTVTGTDGFGCKSEAVATIVVSDAPLVAASITNATPCPGGGAISLTVIGGVQPYIFAWSNGATTQTLSNLVAGNYTVTVFSGPCSVINTYAIAAGVYNPTLSVTNLYSCSARLNWTATASATYYKVRYKVAGTATWNPTVTLGNVLFYDFAGLAANTTYTFSVSAYCASNQNLGWKNKNGKTQTCTTPFNIGTTILTNNTATIAWSVACAPVSYTLQYRKTGTTAWTTVNTANTSATLNGLVNATSYDYRVRATCTGSVNSVFSAIQTFTTAPRLEDVSDANGFSIFPNPNAGSFTLQIPAMKKDGEISIYNITGELIYRSVISSNENSSSQKILLENISSGLYEVVLNDGEQTLKQRLIIQK